MEIADERERLQTWLASGEPPWLPAFRHWLQASAKKNIADIKCVSWVRDLYTVPVTVIFVDGSRQSVTFRKEGDTYGWEAKKG